MENIIKNEKIDEIVIRISKISHLLKMKIFDILLKKEG